MSKNGQGQSSGKSNATEDGLTASGEQPSDADQSEQPGKACQTYEDVIRAINHVANAKMRAGGSYGKKEKAQEKRMFPNQAC